MLGRLPTHAAHASRSARLALRAALPPLPRSQWPVTAAHCHNKPLRTDHGRSRGVSVNMAPKEGGGFSADNRRQVRLALHQTPPPRAYIARAIFVFIPNNIKTRACAAAPQFYNSRVGSAALVLLDLTSPRNARAFRRRGVYFNGGGKGAAHALRRAAAAPARLFKWASCPARSAFF